MKRLLIASLFILGGCSSPQVINYTLTPVSEQAPSGNVASASSVQKINNENVKSSNLNVYLPYKLDRVTVPPQSDDLSLVVRDGNDRLLVLTYDRWTVSLSDELTQALSLTLTDEIGMPPTQSWSLVATNLPHYDIQVDVRRFEMVPGRSANLSASWKIKFTHVEKEPLRSAPSIKHETFDLTCFANFSRAVQPGVLPLVQAQQKNIQQLSQKIAQTLQARQGVEGVTCR